MIKEIESGVGVTDGSVSIVSSKYKLSKGTELIEVLGGVESSLRGHTLKVTSTYNDSISFDIVTEFDGVKSVDNFTHVRKVVRPFTTNINHCPQSVRIPVVPIDIETPALVEINLDVEPLERVGF